MSWLDEEITMLCRVHPEITFNAAENIKRIAVAAEERGRGTAADQLTDEINARVRAATDAIERRRMSMARGFLWLLEKGNDLEVARKQLRDEITAADGEIAALLGKAL